MFERIKAFFAKPDPLPKRSWVTFKNGGIEVDVVGFLKTDAGKQRLAEVNAWTDKLIAEGKIIDESKKR